DHWVVIGEEHTVPTVVFGQKPQPQPPKPEAFLPVNYAYTFRVDMSPVLRQFAEKGYYEAYDGSRVAKADFKGFYIAGGSEPLSWDFVNLSNHGLKLQETQEPNIYAITLKFNPYNANDYQDKEWQLKTDLSKRAQYHSDQPLVDALFNLSLEEATKNIEPDSTFRTGAKWGGVWTRDISYSILLAFAYHEPEVAKISLRKKVKRGRIIQDTGSGGAWPVSSDRTTWALAAWEIYQATGDKKWLQEAYPIIKNTLEDDYKTVYSPLTGMYSGESSFLDWREQTYPKWMSNMDIYVSQNLGTNVVHYQAHRILATMAKMLGEPFQVYEDRAAAIKKGINQQLWMADRGYYAQYLYGRPHLTVSPRFEALGEALSILFGVADADQAKSIMTKSPCTDFGVTCIYPQIPGIPPYHNNAIWPFVQSYWNWAAAKSGNEAALVRGLAAIYRADALFLTNYENMVAQTGDFLGTEINSDRMLWSMAGNLAMVYRVFTGINFEPNGLRFQPVIPKNYGGKRTLSNFKYQQSVLNITVQGYGNRIKTILLDGQALKDALLPNTTTGMHNIVITMANNKFNPGSVNHVANRFSLPNPQVQQEGGRLRWDPVAGAGYYRVYKNGQFEEKTASLQFAIQPAATAEYKVSAVDDQGYESFTSEPVAVHDASAMQIVELERCAASAVLPYTNFSGQGFVEIAKDKNRIIDCKVTVPEA
ncbi:MAG: glycogen debranching protein, partial [Saprospiraceae bacterium]